MLSLPLAATSSEDTALILEGLPINEQPESSTGPKENQWPLSKSENTKSLKDMLREEPKPAPEPNLLAKRGSSQDPSATPLESARSKAAKIRKSVMSNFVDDVEEAKREGTDSVEAIRDSLLRSENPSKATHRLMADFNIGVAAAMGDAVKLVEEASVSRTNITSTVLSRVTSEYNSELASRIVPGQASFSPSGNEVLCQCGTAAVAIETDEEGTFYCPSCNKSFIFP